MGARRNRFKDDISYKDTNAQAIRPGDVSRWAGFPAGIQLHSDCFVHHIQFRTNADRFDTTNDWLVTNVGGGAIDLSDDVFPPHLTVTNAAGDDNSIDAQFTQTGGTGEYAAPTIPGKLYNEWLVRLADANNNAATVEQVDAFVGLAVSESPVTLIDGAADFIGFVKRDITDDATQDIDFVAGATGGAGGALVDQLVRPTSWTTRATASGLSLAQTAVARAARRRARLLGPSDWVRLGFLWVPSQSYAVPFVNREPVSAPISLTGFQPDTELCLSFAVQNGEATAKALHIASILTVIEYGTI